MHLADTLHEQARRYQITLPVELEHGTGITRDASAAGVFFETDLLFSPGVSISFSLVFEHADADGPLRFQCQGEVLRVEQHADKVGVAVRLTSYRKVEGT